MGVPVDCHREMDVVNELLCEEGMLREVSPILFLTDAPGWPVIAARTPDGCVSVGDSLRALLGLSAADEAFVGGWTVGTRLVVSSLGVGLLSMRWRFCAGIGLFLRLELPEREVLCAVRDGLSIGDVDLHCVPEPEAGGADGPRAITEQAAEAMRRIARRLRRVGAAMPQPELFYRVPAAKVLDWIAEIPQAAGCVVHPLRMVRQTYWGQPLPDQPEITVCRWYPERLWEAFLLTCMLLARQYAPTRMLSCTLSVGAEEAECPVDIALRFDVLAPCSRNPVPEPLRRRRTEGQETLPPPPEQPPALPAGIAASMNHLRRAAEFNDAEFYWAAEEPVPWEGVAENSSSDLPAGGADADMLLFHVRAHMVFLFNPHRDLDGDVKAPRIFVYDV